MQEGIWAQYFWINGRISRGSYFGRNVLCGILGYMVSFLSEKSPTDALEMVLLIFFTIGLAVSVWVSISGAVKRLHDVNKSWHWILFAAVPLVNLFLGWYLIFTPGNETDNRFGPAPA